MANIAQRRFSSGEIAPSLYSSVDISSYQNGLRTCKNFIVSKTGSVFNRPGTQYIASTRYGDKIARLISFVVSRDQSYILEFGEGYIRVWLKGKMVDEVETFYAERDLFDIRYSQSADVMILTHEKYPVQILTRMISGTNPSGFSFSMSGLSTKIAIRPPSSLDAFRLVSGGDKPDEKYEYVVTAVQDQTFIESRPSVSEIVTSKPPDAQLGITLIWNPSVSENIVEYNVYKRVNGIYYLLGIAGAEATTDIGGGVLKPSFEDIGEAVDFTKTPPIETSPFDPGNFLEDDGLVDDKVVSISNQAIAIIQIKGANLDKKGIYAYDVTGMTEINYKRFNLEIVGEYQPSLAWNSYRLKTLEGKTVDSSTYGNYTQDQGKFLVLDGNFPLTSGHYQSRRLFAATERRPENIWTSRIGQFGNFSTRRPLLDDDALSFSLRGSQVNPVKHMLDFEKLFLFTENSEHVLSGDQGGTITPFTINPIRVSSFGIGEVPPLPISNSVLFVQNTGKVVRDLIADVKQDEYSGSDISIFSSHLFRNHIITDWCYQKNPNSIIWCVRSDGKLLSLTYVREQQIFAWARHELEGGSVESIENVTEDGIDYVYMLVKRTINGRVVRCIERMGDGEFEKITDAKYMDSHVSLNGERSEALGGALPSIRVASSPRPGGEDVYLITADRPDFSGKDIGNAIHVVISGETFRLKILSLFPVTASGSNRVLALPNKTIPQAGSSYPFAPGEFQYAIDELGGLEHLEGEKMSVIGDGFVLASPHNYSYDDNIMTVVNGKIKFKRNYAIVHAGIPITSDIETLDIDTVGLGSLADKYKAISRVTMHVAQSRGIWAGPRPPTGDDFLEGLREFEARYDEKYNDPVALKTGVVDINIRSEWNSHGRVFVRQVDPLPLIISGIIPSGFIPIGRN